jgi:outer membrane protein TolC
VVELRVKIGNRGGAAGLCLIAALAVGGRPLQAQERTVTLEEAIAMALQAQPAIVQAEGNLDVAHAGQREAWGNLLLPSVSASSGISQGSNNKVDATTGQIRNLPPLVSYSTGLNASLVLFDGFSRWSQTRAARATAASADASLTNQRFQVILQTKQAFFSAVSAAELVKVTQTQVQRSEQQLRISKDKLAAGSAIRSDTLRSTVDLGNARLALLNAQAQLATAEATLARLVGADAAVHASGAPAMPEISGLDTTALRQEVVNASPAVQAAEAQARAAGSQVSVTRSQYMPTVTASYRRNWAGTRDSVSLTPSALAVWPSLTNTWSFNVGLSWPIFNGFTRETNMTRARASREAAEATAADARRQANANFTQQLAALEAAAQQLTIAQASRAAADEDLRVQQERYRLGAATIVDVLTSQVSLGQAEVALVQARLNVLVAKAQIEALLGREL